MGARCPSRLPRKLVVWAGCAGACACCRSWLICYVACSRAYFCTSTVCARI